MVIRNYSDRLSLYLITDKAFKSNFLAVDLLIPLNKETVTANALLPNVLSRGTKNSNDLNALNRRLNLLYGATLTAETTKQSDSLVLTFTMRFIKDRFAFGGEEVSKGAMSLFFEVIKSPYLIDGIFKKEYVESEINNLRDRIEAEINDKRRYVIKKCIEKTCKDEPFGISANGYKEELEKITPESLIKTWQENMKTAKIFAFFFGEISESLLCEKLIESFDKDAEIIPVTTQVKVPSGKPEFFREEAAITQSKLAIAFRSGALDHYNRGEISLFNAIYGAGATSKLFKNVREKLSLCYYCVSRVFIAKGIMLVDSGVELKNYEKAYEEILTQLEDVSEKRITAEEVEAAKRSVRNGYNSMKDSFEALHDWYFSCYRTGKNDTPDDMCQAVQDADIATVCEIASLFKPETVYLLAPEK